jgi:tetratricopeptide (TPR) repeat protein
LKIKSYGFDTYTQPLDLKSKVPVGLLIMREADALYNAGNFSEALKEYEKLYSINPKDEYVERRIKSCNEKITSGSRTIVQELTKELKANVITPQSNSNPASISQNFDEIEFIFVKELGIYIGKYEVTQAQWQSVMGTNPFHNKSPNNPVESISSGYILNFIKKLNNRTGRKYRLPTEAEWVYAAGSKSFKYAGSNYLNEVAWYEQNSDKHTHTVGTKNPNAIGLYDMTGNVCELCRDGELKYKLLGGSFKDNAQDCQLQVGDNGTIRENMSAYEYAGFRLVLEN